MSGNDLYFARKEYMFFVYQKKKKEKKICLLLIKSICSAAPEKWGLCWELLADTS